MLLSEGSDVFIMCVLVATKACDVTIEPGGRFLGITVRRPVVRPC